MKVTKKNGNVVLFDDEKIVKAILKASAEVREEEVSNSMARSVADEVFTKLTAESDIISTAEVRTCVYEILIERGYPVTAQHYMDYKGKA